MYLIECFQIDPDMFKDLTPNVRTVYTVREYRCQGISGHLLDIVVEDDCNKLYIDNNSLTVYIRRLRTKIEDNLGEPKRIATVRGMGYKWNTQLKTPLAALNIYIGLIQDECRISLLYSGIVRK